MDAHVSLEEEMERFIEEKREGEGEGVGNSNSLTLQGRKSGGASATLQKSDLSLINNTKSDSSSSSSSSIQKENNNNNNAIVEMAKHVEDSPSTDLVDINGPVGLVENCDMPSYVLRIPAKKEAGVFTIQIPKFVFSYFFFLFLFPFLSFFLSPPPPPFSSFLFFLFIILTLHFSAASQKTTSYPKSSALMYLSPLLPHLPPLLSLSPLPSLTPPSLLLTSPSPEFIFK